MSVQPQLFDEPNPNSPALAVDATPASTTTALAIRNHFIIESVSLLFLRTVPGFDYEVAIDDQLHCFPVAIRPLSSLFSDVEQQEHPVRIQSQTWIAAVLSSVPGAGLERVEALFSDASGARFQQS